MPRWLALCLTACLLAQTAWAHSKAPAAAPAAPKQSLHALVIGNGDYPGRSNDLPNATRDAELMQRTLQSLGFQVTFHTNLGRQAMLRVLADFAQKLPDDALAWVYFAGHGVQLGGENYLIPTDTGLDTPDRLPLRSVALSTVLERVSTSKAAVNVVVLDACRNNPFVQTGAMQFRSLAPLDGFAQTRAPRGTLVAYSTAPGELAADGAEQGNSTYTAALAYWLRQPGLGLEVVFRRVTEDVRERTQEAQRPWYMASLSRELVLLPRSAQPVAETAMAAPQRPAQPSASTEVAPEVDRSTTGGLVPWLPQLLPLGQGGAAQLMNLGMSMLDRQTDSIRVYEMAHALTADEVAEMERRARQGDTEAARSLGIAYLGEGHLPRNNTQAARWLKMAADKGDIFAMNELAILMFYGRGTPKNEAEAIRLFEVAAAAGHPVARQNLIQAQRLMPPGQPSGR